MEEAKDGEILFKGVTFLKGLTSDLAELCLFQLDQSRELEPLCTSVLSLAQPPREALDRVFNF